MKRSLAILVLASAVGLALAGCTQAAKPPTSVSGPAAGSATVSESAGAPSDSGTGSQSTSPPSGAATPDTKPAATIATLAKYNKVEKGMTLAQVVKIMGPPSKKLGESSSGSIHVAMYGWYGEDTFAVAVVSLTNGKVNAKNQQGLK
jgi:outer membrane protein assembly factor BamE (lipoprotein component of BamABCDE complex)